MEKPKLGTIGKPNFPDSFVSVFTGGLAKRFGTWPGWKSVADQCDAPKEDGLGVEGRLIIQEHFVVYILIIVEQPVASGTFFVMP